MEYNFTPLGTYEDIMSLFARSELRRYAQAGIVPPKKSAFIRRVVEPSLNAAGIVVTALGGILGASRMIAYHDDIMGGLAGKAREDFNPSAPQLEETRRLVAEIERLVGSAPAVLCLMSHPPVLPESLGLNVEMARQALLALHSLRPQRGHARLLIAVDAYALDMLGPFEEGMYAGFMGNYHLGLDRLALHRFAPSRWLMRGAAWWRLPWRASRYLAGGQSLAMVLSGGVPVTARVLYAGREFLWRARRARPQATPVEVGERLMKESKDYAAFCATPLVGGRLRRSAWKMMEAWVVARLSGLWPESSDAAQKGDGSSPDGLAHGALDPEQLDCMRACVRAMGYPDDRVEALVGEFREEFARETPYRERFFRFLLHRVLSRGRPIVLLPMAHQIDAGRMKLSWSDPIALMRYAHGTIYLHRGPGSPEEALPVERFARDFVRVHYT